MTVKNILIAIVLCNLTMIHSWPIGINPKVVGGVEVDSISEFPYQTAIFARWKTGSTLCSGSILSPKFVITCAHCIKGSHNVSVFYGSEKLSTLNYGKNQIVSSENYRIHPNYSTYFNDIALIKMNFDIEFSSKFEKLLTFSYISFFISKTESVKSLRLQNFFETTSNYDNKKLQMASWGVHSNANAISDELRSAKMEVISRDECAQTFPSRLITQSVICTRNSHCSGDSGSMLVDKTESGEFVAIGIASFAYETCREGETKPSVFMRISNYFDFIEANSDLIISKFVDY